MKDRRGLRRLVLAPEALNLQRRLLFEDVLRVQLRHVGVVRRFFREILGRLVLPRGELFLAGVLRNPEIVVADMKLREADLVLGVDLLSSRRLWLSYGSRRIFISSR